MEDKISPYKGNAASSKVCREDADLTDTRLKKSQLRTKMLNSLFNLTEEKRKLFSDNITEKLIDLPEYKDAHTIMVYFSLPEEYDTTRFIEHAIGEGKVLCAPQIDWHHKVLVPIIIKGPKDYKIGRLNIPIPSGDEKIPPNKIDMVLIPGLAFDLMGYRLGRGGGFYDRFLARPETASVVKVAAIFDSQLVFSVPRQSRDVKVDIIVTPHRLLRFI